MLISPPFLPRQTHGEADTDYLDRALHEGAPGQGAFPVSTELNWHGGVHLTAPREEDRALPVRAIADGTLAYLRQPTARQTDPHHPLNYGPGWTDDGCIVLQHQTEIGEGVTVTFFSLYLHLSSIALTDLTTGSRLYRKDVLGAAGSIRGQGDLIHFELIAQDAEPLFGRQSALLEHASQHGRAACNWGDTHFHLPPEIQAYRERPADWTSPENPSPRVTRPAHSLFVRQHYQRGSCSLTTLDERGQILGEHQEPGHFEYDLFDIASQRYPTSPSAGFELLRLGRVIGPDPLPSANTAHWRQIALPDGLAWINLNAPTVTVFSDADFPHWLGWRLIDDDTDPDSHCQSPQVRELLELDEHLCQSDIITLVGDPSTAVSRLSLQQRYEQETQRNLACLQRHHARLRRCAFRFATEWRRAGVAERYGWWPRLHAEEPGIEQDFADFKAHQRALAFWEDAKLPGIDAIHWHLPPRAFIETFRRCGWLSQEELVQLVPMKALRKAREGWVEEPIFLRKRTKERLELWRKDLNKALRIHDIASIPWRLAAFFANAAQETGWFSKTYEDNRQAWYWPWDGRGLLQLTHPDNYIKYWRFRGRIISASLQRTLREASGAAQQGGEKLLDSRFLDLTSQILNWRDAVGDENQNDLSYSATIYWSWSRAAQFADQSRAFHRQTVTTNAGTSSYYSHVPFGQVAATVNFGSPVDREDRIARVYGIQARYQAYTHAITVLTDRVGFLNSEGHAIDIPEGHLARR